MHNASNQTTDQRISLRVRTVYWLLKLTYGIVPIVAGLDKFFNFLTKWSRYLNPALVRIAHMPPSYLMYVIGIIEIIAGCLVLRYTQVGASVVAAWLVAIAINLFVLGKFYDVAVRDIVMAIGALCLVLLASEVEKRHT